MSKQLVGNEWLQERMSELGYTSLEQVANEIGSHKGNLWRYFAGQTIPNMGLLPAMCKTLFCSPTELLHALQLLDPKKKLM
jgi:hypothetical protein